MNKNRRIFIIATVIFVLIVIIFTIDMGRRTTAPWNKKKQVMRAFDGDTPPADSTANDTIR